MGQKEHSLAIQEKMAEIKKLRRQQDELYAEIEVSLALQSLWPEVFKHGSCKTYFVGSQMYHRMVVIDGKGDRQNYLLQNVPTILWYKHLMKMYETSHISNWPKALRDEFKRRLNS